MSLTKREGLKMLGWALLGAAGAGRAAGVLSVNRAPLFGIGSQDDIISEIPPELTDVEIPVLNEQWRSPERILNDAHESYNKLREVDPSLPELVYEEPPNYLDIPSLYSKMSSSVDLKSLANPSRLLNQLQETLTLNDQLYFSFAEASQGGIDGFNSLIVNDPGSGLVGRLRNMMKEKYGSSIEIWDLARSNSMSADQKELVEQEVLSWIDKVDRFVVEQRNAGAGKKLSSGVIYGYFLRENRGNIMRSLWDTSNWFEIKARNDSSNLQYYPSKEKARYLADNFLDESSLAKSINWLNDVVGDDDVELWETDTALKMKWKDYLLINRVGGFYHFWNIIALAGCVSPPILKRIVASYSRNGYPSDKNMQYYSTDGREKMSADDETASHAVQIDKNIRKYLKKK